MPAIDGYRVLGIIGRGGMGIVYKAEQVQLNRLVALKMIRAGKVAEAGSQSRFRNEVLAVARVQHANIVQIFEVGEVDHQPFFAMELVDGGSLAERLAGMPQPPQAAAELVERLARAVHFAHERGILHRDLKPANILLVSGVVSGQTTHHSPLTTQQPKIADFGLAKFLEEEPGAGTGSASTGGVIQGTPSYMAPEQAGRATARGRVGPAVDVYALGAILYEMLTGRPPFTAPTPLDTLLKVLNEDPQPPRRVQPCVPRNLETICLKCLAKEPARRYASAAALAEDLHRFLVGKVITARPVSSAERLVRWSRRHPGVASLLATLAVVLIVGFALVTWKWRAQAEAADVATDEKHRADQARREAQRLAARGLVDQAIAQGDHGNIDRALHLLVKGLELAVDGDDADLERAIRINLTAWRTQLIRRRALVPHANWVWAVTYSPDGQRWATASRDRTARVWSTATGEPMSPPLHHDFPVWTVAFSPDGKKLLTGSGDPKTGAGELRLWDVASGTQEPGVPAIKHFVTTAAFSRDGSTVLAMAAGHAYLCKLNADASLVTLPHPHGVWTAVFSPDGATILTAGADGTARLWDVATGKPSGVPLTHKPPNGLAPGHRCEVVAAAFSPDGQHILTAGHFIGRENTMFDARLWRASSGEMVGQPWPHRGPLKAVLFSPDGRRALTAGVVLQDAAKLTGAARLWDVTTGKTIGPALTDAKPIWAAAFSPDGRVVLTGSEGGRRQFWLAATGLPLGAHHYNIGNVNAVAFSPDGKTALTSRTYEPSAASIWEAPTGTADVVPAVYAPETKAIACSPDSAMLVTAGAGGAQRWDAVLGTALGPPLHADARVNAVSFSPNGTIVATGGEDRTVRLWDSATGNALGQPIVHAEPVHAVAFHPDGATLLTGAGGTTRLWHLADGKPLGQPMDHGWTVLSVAFGREGNAFVVGTDGGTAQLWDGTTQQPRGPVLRHQVGVTAVAVSPDGKTLATASNDRTAWLWDVATGQPLTSPLQHEHDVLTAAFSHHGRLLVTGSRDGAARLWDVATGLRVGPLLAHPGSVLATFQSEDKVATLAADGLFRRWDVPAPAIGTTREIKLRIMAFTASEMANKGILRELNEPELHRLRAELK